ncbi:MAG TPA: hypothetical protein VET65_05540 [Candidatus Limnocylindrales bacterium]|nr:hypothetical protein [Candidatus Limnocylindrales bacterium]
MASYTIDIPDELHREIQERRHLIDVSGVCRDALRDAVDSSHRAVTGTFQFGRDIADDLTRMFNGAPRPAE